MYVCACARIFCIVMLEPLLMSALFICIILDIIFHLDLHYVVILCLFSALNRRVGALQISIIIIIKKEKKKKKKKKKKKQ